MRVVDAVGVRVYVCDVPVCVCVMSRWTLLCGFCFFSFNVTRRSSPGYARNIKELLIEQNSF